MGVLAEKEQANGTGWVRRQHSAPTTARRWAHAGKKPASRVIRSFLRPDIGIPAAFPDRRAGMDLGETLALFLRCFQQRTQRLDGDSESSASESVHVSGVDTDNFAFGVKDRASAATVGCGRIVN